MDEVGDIAQRIHKRRVLSNAKANQAQAKAEALLYTAYGFQPSLNHFQPPGMTMFLQDEEGRSVTVVCGEGPALRVGRHLQEKADVVVFAVGTSFKDCDILGWMPSLWIREAPRAKGLGPEQSFEVVSGFMVPMPREFNFVTPEVVVPRIWDYTYEGWWTPLGFYLYDETARQRIETYDRESAG